MEKRAGVRFCGALKAALDQYQPGWDVRRHAIWDEAHQDEWNQNRRFKVWVDTLKRWVQGDHFPQLSKFEDFLEAVEFPVEVAENLLKLFHEARLERRRITGPSVEPGPASMILRPHSNPDRAIRVAGSPPINLTRPFIGRQRQVHDLSELLANPSACLVTVVGRNGIGKTALVCQTLHQIEHGHWPDSAVAAAISRIVYLSTHTGSLNLKHLFLNCLSLVDEEAARHLKTLWDSTTSAEARIDALLAALSNETSLAFLDNLGAMLDEEGYITDPEMRLFVYRCLRHASRVRLLITSRIEPALPGDLRHLNHLLVLENGLTVTEGIQLLRGLDPNGICGLRDGLEDQLCKVVQKVHGVPRALEVIAGILEDNRLMHLDDILEKFGELSGIQEMMREGFRYLDGRSQKVVEVLAVLRRPVPPEAVIFMLEPVVPGFDLTTILHRLTRTRMVVADRSSGLISLQPIDLEYAYAQLPEDGSYNRCALERRAAVYYEQFCTPPDTWQSIADLEPQLIAFEHYVRAGDCPRATQLIGDDGYQALFRWGHLQRVITLRQQQVNRLGDSALERHNLYELALALRTLGQLREATACFEQALALSAEDAHHNRDLWVGLADIYRYQERYAEALGYYGRALKIVEPANLKAEVAALLGLGLIYHQIGDDKQAMARVQAALNVAKTAGNTALEGNCLETLGNIYRNLAHHQTALFCVEQALVYARQAGDLQGEGNRLGLWGTICADLGRYVEALEAQQQALEIATRGGDLYSQCKRRVRLCGISVDLAAYDLALEYGQEAYTIARKIGVLPIERCSLLYLARAEIARGQLEVAEQKLMTASTLASQTHNHLDWQSCNNKLAQAYLHLGRFELAHEALQRALRYPVPIFHHFSMALHGVVLVRLGDYDAARSHFQQALVIADGLLMQTPEFFAAQYSRGLALAGLAVLDSSDEQATYQWRALEAYQGAYTLCRAPGVLEDAMRLLAELQPLDYDEILPSLAAVLA